MTGGQTKESLQIEIRQLKARLEELEELVRICRGGSMGTQALLAQIVESSTDAIFSLNPDGKVETWNKAAEHLFGYTAKDIIGQPALAYLVPPGHAEESLKKFNDARSGRAIGPMDTVRRRKDGSEVQVSVMAFPILDTKGEVAGVSVNVRDITERKQAEDRLKLFRALLDQSNDAIEIFDSSTLRFLDVNETACRALGYTREELLSMTIHDIDPAFKANPEKFLSQARSSGKTRFETVHRRKDGSIFPVEINTKAIVLDKRYGLTIARDITERKKVEQALRASEQRLRTIVETEPECIKVVDSGGRLLEMNPAGLAMLEAGSLKEAQQKRLVDYIDPEYQEAFLSLYRRVMKGESGILEFRIKGLKGTPRWLETHAVPMRDENGDVAFLLGVTRDITEHKQAEEDLYKAQQVFRSLIENSPDIIARYDRDCRRTYVNPAYLEVARIPHDELLATAPLQRSPLPKDGAEILQDLLRRVLDSGTAEAIDFEWQRAGNNNIWFNIYAIPEFDHEGHVTSVMTVSRDITRRKQAEAALQHTSRVLATLSEVNRHLVHATDEHELLSAVCQTIVEQQGYRMAWVGYLEHDEAKNIRPVARAGFEDGYLETVKIEWGDTKDGRGPGGMAARSGQIQVIQDIQTDDRMRSWREENAKRGYASVIVLPLAIEGKVFGVLAIYADRVNAFGEEEIRLLEEMADDLAFGVQSLHTRHERNLAQEEIRHRVAQLQNNLEDTVKAISTIVEMRDPYTAGHETRVAQLAVTIAREMGLSDEQIRGIRLAGEVHDLGKVQIPAEILSKPGRLTEIEFSLVKAHPQAGYDILKGIDFPWPIAQTVLQHHERIDGSGYPQGLKGEEIILEARILCVADVVEAMHSHRPYRPGLGLESALGEIRNGRGRLYDPAVVDTCLKLFQEGRFKFEN